MSVGGHDLDQAIEQLWNDSGLDSEFTQHWTSGQRVEFVALENGEAAPSQPWPYAVYETSLGETTDRMSRDKISLYEVRDIELEFRVHAKLISGDTRTAKEIAGDLAEEVMKIFGGHPTETPQVPQLDNGAVLLLQYQTDYGVRTGDDEHSQVIRYTCRVDVPVAV